MTDGYGAVYAPIKNLRKHSNADRLQVGEVLGFSVIVGLDTRDGDLGILLREGSCVSRDFALENNLYRKHPDTGEVLGGYLCEKGRIRSLNLRGEKSEGLFLLSPCLNFIGYDPLIEGEMFNEYMGVEFVKKYETPAQVRAKQHNSSKSRRELAAFPKHYNTSQLRDTAFRLAGIPGAKYIFTEKLHGTSGRTGRLPVEQPLSWWAKLWNCTIGAFTTQMKPKTRIELVSGTRNCVLDPTSEGEKAMDYRQKAEALLAPYVGSGMTVYYEIVGYGDNGSPIMGRHEVKGLKEALGKDGWKEYKKEYGDLPVVYSYGCAVGEFKVYVYRITSYMGVEQKPREWRWDEVVESVSSWDGVETVPELTSTDVGVSAETLVTLADVETRGSSTLDNHIREGVCLRVEHSDGTVEQSVKHKGFIFCTLEGIKTNDPEFIDLEAIS